MTTSYTIYLKVLVLLIILKHCSLAKMLYPLFIRSIEFMIYFRWCSVLHYSGVVYYFSPLLFLERIRQREKETPEHISLVIPISTESDQIIKMIISIFEQDRTYRRRATLEHLFVRVSGKIQFFTINFQTNVFWCHINKKRL